MVRRQTRAQKRNRRQQNKSRRNNRRQNKSLRRKRQSRRKLRGGVNESGLRLFNEIMEVPRPKGEDGRAAVKEIIGQLRGYNNKGEYIGRSNWFGPVYDIEAMSYAAKLLESKIKAPPSYSTGRLAAASTVR